MAQNKGEKGPDRLDTAALTAWKALKIALTTLELAVILQDCAHSLAAVDGFSGDPRYQNAARHNAIVIAIADANVRSLLADEGGISTIVAYEKWKKPGDPGRRIIYLEFGSWAAAKNAAGIGRIPQPGPAILRTKGERNRRGAGVQWSLDLRVRAVAKFREFGCPGAYRLGTDEYADWRENWPEVLPAYKTVIGQIEEVVDGKLRLRREYSWQEMNRLAEALALSEPHTFPKLAERARLNPS